MNDLERNNTVQDPRDSEENQGGEIAAEYEKALDDEIEAFEKRLQKIENFLKGVYPGVDLG